MNNPFPFMMFSGGAKYNWSVWAIFTVFFLYFIVLSLFLLSPIVECTQTGDFGVMEIDVIDAMHGKQLLGSYSRVGFSHPGPAFFYLCIPLCLLLGMPGGISLTALGINSLSIMVILVCSLRGGRQETFSIQCDMFGAPVVFCKKPVFIQPLV